MVISQGIFMIFAFSWTANVGFFLYMQKSEDVVININFSLVVVVSTLRFMAIFMFDKLLSCAEGEVVLLLRRPVGQLVEFV